VAEIAPFRGVRYAVERVGRLEDVVAPPYDVITPEQRRALVERAPFNVARIDLPVGQDDVKYDHAGRLWRQWRADKVLRDDPAPAFYLLEETFATPLGRLGVRRGFIAALVLEELGKDGVRPHEQTFSGPKADRLKLMRATRANLSQVFALYRDPERRLDAAWAKVMSAPAEGDVRVPEGRRRMWRVADPEIISLAEETLRASALTIADGHHRYETAVTYRDECRARHERGEAESVMVYLSSMDDPDLTILPAHRTMKLGPEADMKRIRRRLEEHFDLEPVASDQPDRWLAERLSQDTGEPYRFGLFAREWGWLLATLRSWDEVSEWIDPLRSEAWRRLDVAVLHEVILGKIAGVSHRSGGSDAISYTIDPAAGRAAVTTGSADLLCMLRPTSAKQIAGVADAGDTMPHKSTYFYPKLLTGLVMRSLEP